MKRDDVEISPFPVTSWSMVRNAADATSASQRSAMGELLKRYLPALRAHLVLDRRMRPDEADDLLQTFVVAKVLEQKLVERADRARGKFRTFLIQALQYFAIDQKRAAGSKRRSPAGGPPASIDDGFDPSHDAAASPQTEFERAWAREVINEAVKRMRAECAVAHRDDLWGVFEHRVLKPSLDGVEPTPYANLPASLRIKNEQQASNLLMTAKRMFHRNLRSVVAEYAADANDLETEMRSLREALSV
jgi:RNA polymerase sigma-70 factor (ECF subfamily)